MAVAVHVACGWRGPRAVGEGDRVLPRRRNVRWGSSFAVKAMQFPAKGHKQFCGAVAVHVHPQRWRDGDLVVVVAAAAFHGSTPFLDRRVCGDVVAPRHALSIETRCRGRVPRDPTEPVVHAVFIGVDRERGGVSIPVWRSEGKHLSGRGQLHGHEACSTPRSSAVRVCWYREDDLGFSIRVKLHDDRSWELESGRILVRIGSWDRSPFPIEGAVSPVHLPGPHRSTGGIDGGQHHVNV